MLDVGTTATGSYMGQRDWTQVQLLKLGTSGDLY